MLNLLAGGCVIMALTCRSNSREGRAMSEENVHEFIKKLEESPEMRQRVRQARDDITGEICKIAEEHGFKFSAEELRKVLHDKWDGHISFSEGDDEDMPNIIIASERPGY
jgi:predicted ribosomally synthesized peptide with nif11-like leader